jgi:hypothetical protein
MTELNTKQFLKHAGQDTGISVYADVSMWIRRKLTSQTTYWTFINIVLASWNTKVWSFFAAVATALITVIYNGTVVRTNCLLHKHSFIWCDWELFGDEEGEDSKYVEAVNGDFCLENPRIFWRYSAPISSAFGMKWSKWYV